MKSNFFALIHKTMQQAQHILAHKLKYQTKTPIIAATTIDNTPDINFHDKFTDSNNQTDY